MNRAKSSRSSARTSGATKPRSFAMPRARSSAFASASGPASAAGRSPGHCTRSRISCTSAGGASASASRPRPSRACGSMPSRSSRAASSTSPAATARCSAVPPSPQGEAAGTLRSDHQSRRRSAGSVRTSQRRARAGKDGSGQSCPI